MSTSKTKLTLLQLKIHEPLLAAANAGAGASFTNLSDYVRRALVEKLRADGIPIDGVPDPRIAGLNGMARRVALQDGPR
jgi:hypothetical protein